MITHFVSATYNGEICGQLDLIDGFSEVCRNPATHKIGEEIPHDEPSNSASASALLGRMAGTVSLPRHNFTAYVCCAHFSQIFGPAAKKWCDQKKEHTHDTQ